MERANAVWACNGEGLTDALNEAHCACLSHLPTKQTKTNDIIDVVTPTSLSTQRSAAAFSTIHAMLLGIG